MEERGGGEEDADERDPWSNGVGEPGEPGDNGVSGRRPLTGESGAMGASGASSDPGAVSVPFETKEA